MAIHDVVRTLIAAGRAGPDAPAEIELGGADVLTYRQPLGFDGAVRQALRG